MSLSIQSIGIALAAYQPDYVALAEQLETIRAQTFSNWNCFITLDSSLDKLSSVPALQTFFSDSRFHWCENPTRVGHKKNFEAAIQAATRSGADAIACSDQDDVWYPEKLSICARALEEAGPLSLVHSDMHVLLPAGKLPRTAWEIERRGTMNVKPEHFLIRNVVAGCASLFDAELARRFPQIPDEAEFHDHWYALLASVHGKVVSIPKPLLAYRQHSSNVVGVSPFRGMFWVPEASKSASAIFMKCRNGWNKSYRLARALDKAAHVDSHFLRGPFLGSRDLGLGILSMGLRNYFRDPPLARACIARAVGKLLSLGKGDTYPHAT